MDVVDDSNLQRQILHNVERIGDRKVDSAKKTLTLLNPDVDVVTYDVRLGEDNVMDVLAGPDGNGWDAIVDGTDNFPTRYLVNDASVKLGIPVVHGSIFRFEGMVTVFDPKQGPTYRDMVPEPPPADMAPSCAEAGVLGVLPGIVGSLQAIEAIKLLLGLGDSLRGRLLAYDALGDQLPRVQGPGRPDQRDHLGQPRPHRGRRGRGALRAAAPRPAPRLTDGVAVPRDGRDLRLARMAAAGPRPSARPRRRPRPRGEARSRPRRRCRGAEKRLAQAVDRRRRRHRRWSPSASWSASSRRTGTRSARPSPTPPSAGSRSAPCSPPSA